MYAPQPDILSLFVVAALVVFSVYDRYQKWAEPTEEEQLRQAYADGKIGEQELERRLEFHLDDRNAEIVRWLDDNVSGVAETKGKALAKRFDSLDALRRADHDELTAIHGIGDSTAAAIRRSFDEH